MQCTFSNDALILGPKKQIFLSSFLAQKNITSLTFFKVFASLESSVETEWKTRTPTGCTVQGGRVGVYKVV